MRPSVRLGVCEQVVDDRERDRDRVRVGHPIAVLAGVIGRRGSDQDQVTRSADLSAGGE